MNFHLSILHFIVTIQHRFQKNKIKANYKIFTLLINISSGIGDGLMAEPMLRALKKSKPEIKIDLLVSTSTRPIYKNNELVDQLFLLELRVLKTLKLIGLLRKRRYDAYIGTIPSNTLSQILIPYMSNIPFRIKHRTPHRGSRDYDFLFHQIEPIPEGRHRIECNLDLLKHVGFDNESFETKPEFLVSEITIRTMKNNLIQKGFDDHRILIGFHPGCNPRAAVKRWAPNNYAGLMNYFFKKWNAQILIVGGEDEKADAIQIESLLLQKPISYVGQADLHETAALIKQCSFFVSNDSGIMHLAVAVGIPVFAIFGPKDERHIGPYGNKHTVIRESADVNSVTVEKVVKTVLQSEYGLKSFDNKQ